MPYVMKAMAANKVPGVALTAVRDDRVLFAGGFGRRSVRHRAPVDADTLFQLASCGKAFTAAAVGILVDEGRIAWDDPVADHLPGFRLADPMRTAHVTVRDLLTHRTGLPGGDLLWASGQFGREETLRRLRFLRPAHGLRERFEYQNLMYVVAGELVGAVSGIGYDTFVRRRIFGPLRMRTSLTNTASLGRRRNVAEPHANVRGQAVRIPRWEDPIGSGDGSILSTARDLAPWLRVQLHDGSAGHMRLLRRSTVREMHALQIPIRADRWELDFFRVLGERRPRLGYGLGWFLLDYGGLQIVRHGGGIDGMSCVVTLVPEAKLGAAVLGNLEGTLLPEALAFWIIDRSLGRPERDWSAAFLDLLRRERGRREAARRRRAAARVRGTRPTLPLNQYAGRYADDYYGHAIVTLRRRRLFLRFGRTFAGPLSHWHHDTFSFQPMRRPGMPPMLATFQLNAKAHVEALRLEAGPGEPIRFLRTS
jgi:CubicO group peptidase (beta-lactamase class C family)